MEISTKNYPYLSWAEALEDLDVERISFEGLEVHESWEKLFSTLHLQVIADRLVEEIKLGKVVFPYPDLMFKAFEKPLDKVRVVIVGQDPYHGMESEIPQAMGLSFSVPRGIKTPRSLANIYLNLVKYGHLREVPNHGNLERLQDQGVLFLNSALTVVQATPNAHQSLWKFLTMRIIQTLDSSEITFVLWGKDAIDKGVLLKKSHQIRSSHPSGLSCRKPCGSSPAFMDSDFSRDLGIDWNVLLD